MYSEQDGYFLPSETLYILANYYRHQFICHLFAIIYQLDRYGCIYSRALRQRKLCQSQNLIRDSNWDFQINPDPDVCRIAPKIYWIHSLVSASHFARCRVIGQWLYEKCCPKMRYSTQVRDMKRPISRLFLIPVALDLSFRSSYISLSYVISVENV